MRKISIPHTLLPYPARIQVLDAIYVWRLAQELKEQGLRQQLDCLNLMQRLSGLSKARCYLIVTEKTELDDYPVREGYRQTPKDKGQNK